VRRALISALLVVFSSYCSCFATPIESVPTPEVQGSDQIGAGVPQIGPTIKVPDTSVHLFLRNGTDSRFEVFFIDLRYGQDLEDFQSYKAWCLEKDGPIRRNALHKVRLYSPYSPDLPPKLRDVQWDRINYIINHKPESASKKSIQEAIWYFTNGGKKAKLSPEAVRLIEEAKEKGKDYIPGDGDLIAVVCVPLEPKQPFFVELPVPPAVPVVSPVVALPPVLAAASSALYGLAATPLFFLPLAFHSSPSPPSHEHEHHGISEPSTLGLLLTAAMCCILVVRRRLRAWISK